MPGAKLRILVLFVSILRALATSDAASVTDLDDNALQRVLRRLETQADGYDKDLAELVSFPSVSALPEHQADLQAAAEWLAGRLKTAGLQAVEVLPTDGPQPVVYGEWLAGGADASNRSSDPRVMTVLVYGHYDVQPVDPIEAWDTPPFQLVKRDGHFYGRGVDDDKGGLLEAVQAVEAWLQETGAVPVNVKFLLEGQEEVMSPHLPAFLRRHRARLASSLALSADGGQPAAERGGLSLGLRGIASLQLHVSTAATDLHSGMKGGSVPNANHVLVQLLAGLREPHSHRVSVEGFYEDVVPMTEQDRQDVREYGFDANKEASELGLYGYVGEAGYDILEQRWHRPTLEVVGMYGGFTGEGIKTVIPRSASAKISCRLVPQQTPEDIRDKVSRHIARHCPAYARCNVSALGGGAFPWSNPRHSPGNAAAAAVHEALSGKPPLVLRDGATIPALAAFQQVLGLDTTKFGWGLSDKIHAPNERLRTEMYNKGRRAWAMILYELARQHRIEKDSHGVYGDGVAGADTGGFGDKIGSSAAGSGGVADGEHRTAGGEEVEPSVSGLRDEL